VRTLDTELDRQAHDHYASLTETEVKTLVVDDKWMAQLRQDVQQELERVFQTLTSRIRELAERYDTPLHKLETEVAALSAKVEEHLKKMGAV
jgi:type I restriction enzyme M protein